MSVLVYIDLKIKYSRPYFQKGKTYYDKYNFENLCVKSKKYRLRKNTYIICILYKVINNSTSKEILSSTPVRVTECGH